MKRFFTKTAVFFLLFACLAATGCARQSDVGFDKPETTKKQETTVEETTVPETTAPSMPVEFEPESSQVFVCDSEGVLLIDRGADETIYPASLTKLLTAQVALSVLKPDFVVDVGAEASMIKAGSSVAFVQEGHSLSVEMLVEAMLLPSGNDAAYAIACAAGREILENPDAAPTTALTAFVEEMNDYAKELGCTASNFTVPDGLDGAEHYSTCRDMAIICSAAAKNKTIRKYASLKEDSVTYASGHTNNWKNSNLQLHPDSDFYNENVKGLKTGSLTDYYCLATLYVKGDEEYIIGTFGSVTKEGRYRDTAKLIEEIDGIE